MTGATGFVGSNLARELLNCGYNLKFLVRGKNIKERVGNIFRKLYKQPEEYDKVRKKIEVIEGDISKKYLGISLEDLNRLSQQVTSVFHCAALVSFDKTKKSNIERVNVEGTKNVLDFMRRFDLNELHYISTAYIAGQRKGIVYEDELDEGQIFNNPYEESKFKAEKLIREYQSKYPINTTVYRPSIIVGDSKTGKTSSFVGFYGIIKQLWVLRELFKEDIKRGGQRAKRANVSFEKGILILPLRVPGLINKTLNLVPIDYVVKVIIRVFKEENLHSKVYHIINPNPPTLGYIQKLVSKALNISGVKVVNPEELRTRSATYWEKFFLEMIKDYIPYLEKEEPIFSDKNTQRVLNKSLCCPRITLNLIGELISHCVTTNWGKKDECLFNSATGY